MKEGAKAGLDGGAVVWSFRFLASNEAPEKKASLRAAEVVILAYTLGVVLLFRFVL
jgi:hypothetical protein